MKLTAAGWHRDHGTKTLFSGSLNTARVVKEPVAQDYDEIIVETSDISPEKRGGGWAEIKFRVDTKNQPLNGEYQFKLFLNKLDILKIFVSAFSNPVLSFLNLKMYEAEFGEE